MKAEADTDVHGGRDPVYGLCQVQAYGRTTETVSIICFDGCGVGVGEGLQCLLIKVLG